MQNRPVESQSSPWQSFSVATRAVALARAGTAVFVAGLLFSGGAAAHSLLSGNGRIFVSMLAMTALFAAFTWFGVRPAFTPTSYDVEMSAVAVRQRGGIDHPWDAITSLSYRPILHRVELLDARGKAAVTLELQLERFAEALQIALTHCGRKPATLNRDFVYSPKWLFVGGVAGSLASSAIAVAMYLNSGKLFGFLVPVLLVVGTIVDFRATILRVTFAEADFSIVRSSGVTTHRYADVRRFGIFPVGAGHGNSRLQLGLEFSNRPVVMLPLQPNLLFPVHDVLAERCPASLLSAA